MSKVIGYKPQNISHFKEAFTHRSLNEKDDKGKPKDKKDNKNGEPNENKKQQPQQGKLSPQQVKNLLEAMNNEEKKVQDKINAKKAKGVKIKTEKDW